MAMSVGGKLAAFTAKCKAVYYGPSGRPRPCNFGIVGRPGLGKTDLAATCHRAVANVLGTDFEPMSVKKFDSTFKFFDTTDSSIHRYWTFDEVGAISEKTEMAPALANLLKAMGEEAFPLPMANVDAMNTEFAMQYSTVIISNDLNFGTKGIIAYPAAFFRRFVRINVEEVLKEVCGEGDSTTDISKLTGDVEQKLYKGKIEVSKQHDGTHDWYEVAKFSSLGDLYRALLPIIE